MRAINRQKFLTELAKLLTFMYEEDRQLALRIYERMFDAVEDEYALIHGLVSPTRQAVVIARAYDAKERKLSVASSSKDEDGYEEKDEIPHFVLEINRVFKELFPENTAMIYEEEEQFSLFDTEEKAADPADTPSGGISLEDTQEFFLNLSEDEMEKDTSADEDEADEEPGEPGYEEESGVTGEEVETPIEDDASPAESGEPSYVDTLFQPDADGVPVEEGSREAAPEAPEEDIGGAYPVNKEIPEGDYSDGEEEESSSKSTPEPEEEEEQYDLESILSGFSAAEPEASEEQPPEAPVTATVTDDEPKPETRHPVSAGEQLSARKPLPFFKTDSPSEQGTQPPQKPSRKEKAAERKRAAEKRKALEDNLPKVSSGSPLRQKKEKLLPKDSRKKEFPGLDKELFSEDSTPELKAKTPLLVLFLIVAVPVTLALVALLLAPTLVCLAVSLLAIVLGGTLIISAFSGFAVLADIMLLLGAAIIALAVGLLFLWLCFCLVGDVIVGLIRAVSALCRKWCYEEVTGR